MWNRYVYLINTGQAICIDILFMATILLVYAEHIQNYVQSGRNSFCTQIDFFIFLIEICSFSSFQWFPLHGNYRTVFATHLQPHHTCSGKVQHWLGHIYNYLSPYQHLYHTGTYALSCFIHESVSDDLRYNITEYLLIHIYFFAYKVNFKEILTKVCI